MRTIINCMLVSLMTLLISACGTLGHYRQESATIIKVIPVIISTDNAYSLGVIDMQEYEQLQTRGYPGCDYRSNGKGHFTTIECTDNDKHFVNAVEITYLTSKGQYLSSTYKANRPFVVGQKVIISVFNDLVLK